LVRRTSSTRQLAAERVKTITIVSTNNAYSMLELHNRFGMDEKKPAGEPAGFFVPGKPGGF
jgi:hypothetical protein